MWLKNRYVIHLPRKFALFVSGITQPLSQGFFLKKKKKKFWWGLGEGALSKRKSISNGFLTSACFFFRTTYPEHRKGTSWTTWPSWETGTGWCSWETGTCWCFWETRTGWCSRETGTGWYSWETRTNWTKRIKRYQGQTT